MAVLQDININVYAQPSEKRLRSFLVLSQNENGRTINFRILGSPLPSSCTATLSGTKPDGNVYSTSGIVAGNFVIVQEDIQMTAVAGVWDAKLDIVNGSHNIMTAIIRITVEGDVVAPGSVPSNSQLDGYIAQAKFYAEESRVEAYGSPLTAATKSAMIDKNRVYVYTGSESNMTAGNWYYWNGTAWVSGGVYNSAAVDTDTTLTLPGKAADAKATGDAIEELKEDLNIVSDDVDALKTTVNGIHESVELYDKSTNVSNNCLRADGTYRATTAYVTTDYMPLESSYDYVYTGLYVAHTYAYACFYTSEKVVMSDYSVCLYEQSPSSVYSLAVPTGAAYVRFSLYHSDNYDTENTFSFLRKKDENGLEDDIEELKPLDILRGKTALFFGDSICNGSSAGDGKDGWAGRIGRNNAMDWHNYGVNGATIASVSGHHNISADVVSAYSTHPNADYIILEGGTNDADNLHDEGLGTYTETDYSGSYDTSTFSGAFETMLYNAVQQWPHAQIGYIAGHKMGNGDNLARRRRFFVRAMELCVKWGIPYIDLYTFTKLNRQLSAQYDSSMTGAENIAAHKLYTDGQHLTPDGYDLITPCIEEWMRTI